MCTHAQANNCSVNGVPWQAIAVGGRPIQEILRFHRAVGLQHAAAQQVSSLTAMPPRTILQYRPSRLIAKEEWKPRG